MTQDAGIMVKEQGAWLTINVGTKDAPRLMRLKLTPADFEELNRINAKLVESAKPSKGNNADAFMNDVVSLITPHVVDWNLHGEDGKIELTEENKRRQLGRFMTAFATPIAKEDDLIDEDGDPIESAKTEGRPTALSMILGFIGDYSNFLEA